MPSASIFAFHHFFDHFCRVFVASDVFFTGVCTDFNHIKPSKQQYFEINSVDPNDAGKYICLAENVAGLENE